MGTAHRPPLFEWFFGICLLSVVFYFFLSPWWAACVMVIGTLLFLGFCLHEVMRNVKMGLRPALRERGGERFLRELAATPAGGTQTLVGRAAVAEAARIILGRKTDNNLILVGGKRSGKSTILTHVATTMRYEKEKRDMMPFWVLDVARLFRETSGTLSEKEHVIRALCDELLSTGRIVLVLENAEHYLAQSPHHDLSPIFALYAADPRSSLVLLLRSEAYEKLAGEEPVLASFEVLAVPEPTPEETREIVRQHFAPLEARAPLFAEGALERLLEAAGRFPVAAAYHERVIELAEEIVLALPDWENNKKEKRKERAPLVTQERVEQFLRRQPILGEKKVHRLLGRKEGGFHREPNVSFLHSIKESAV